SPLGVNTFGIIMPSGTKMVSDLLELQPAAWETVSVTTYIPAPGYTWPGSHILAESPSPNVQNQLVTAGLLVSVNAHVVWNMPDDAVSKPTLGEGIIVITQDAAFEEQPVSLLVTIIGPVTLP